MSERSVAFGTRFPPTVRISLRTPHVDGGAPRGTCSGGGGDAPHPVRLGNYALLITGAGARVEENRFVEPVVAGTAARAAVLINDSTAQRYSLRRNHLDNGAAGNAAYLVRASNTSPTVFVDDNLHPGSRCRRASR